jgi:hypothetical protein
MPCSLDVRDLKNASNSSESTAVGSSAAAQQGEEGEKEPDAARRRTIESLHGGWEAADVQSSVEAASAVTTGRRVTRRQPI